MYNLGDQFKISYKKNKSRENTVFKGKKYRTVYMHMNSINVKIGDIVTITSVVGTVGSTGKSTGAHLHFAILKDWIGSTYYNPRNYVKFPAMYKKFNSRFY